MKARKLIAEGALNSAQLGILFRAFDLAWAKLAPEIGSNPLAIEVSRLKLATVVLAIGDNTSRIADTDLLADTALKAYRVNTAPTPLKV